MHFTEQRTQEVNSNHYQYQCGFDIQVSVWGAHLWGIYLFSPNLPTTHPLSQSGKYEYSCYVNHFLDGAQVIAIDRTPMAVVLACILEGIRYIAILNLCSQIALYTIFLTECILNE